MTGMMGAAGIKPDDRNAAVSLTDWQMAWSPAGESPATRPPTDATWIAAGVPGTAAAALRGAGIDPATIELDEMDWWFRTTFPAAPATAAERITLRLAGVATIHEAWLNGESVAAGDSMYAEHVVDSTDLLHDHNDLLVVCRALGPELRRQRRPRARWRTKLVDDNALRWFRTTLLGRAPGYAPGPPVVGLWRPVTIERERAVTLERARLRAGVAADGTGVLTADIDLRGIGATEIRAASLRLDGPDGTFRAPLPPFGPARIEIPGVTRWWPHTHGEPARHAVTLVAETSAGTVERPLGHVGFRTIEPGPDGHDIAIDGLDLRVNGRRVFARGAVWSPGPDLTAVAEPALRRTLERVRSAGMNMLRIPGIGAYESALFHDLCDELGILVWQDLAFANLDYPFADEAFHATAIAEVDALIERLAARPSLAVVCGNSEIEQQVAMLGLDASAVEQPFYRNEVPERLLAAGCDAVYVPSAPSGGDRPFRTDRGVANYYGVGGYRRPLSDVRLARVRFAAECLAFANVPDEDALEGLTPGTAGWKAGVPRDNGSAWDFEDVRDHYLAELYDVEPAELRRSDPVRYLELGRLVTGEVMAEVFGEWRRAGSGNGGGLVLWLRDLRRGAGWGVLDDRGAPKAAWHHLRRALTPVAVWMTDEGLNGIRVHAANDGPRPFRAELRVAMYRDFEVLVETASEALAIGSGETIERDLETMLGRFVDASWAYRFGPPAAHLVVASLHRAPARGGGSDLLSQAFRFPAARPVEAEPAQRLGVTATLAPNGDGAPQVVVRSRRYVHGVRVRVPGYTPSDDAFGIEPAGERVIELVPDVAGTPAPRGGVLTAANLDGRVTFGREATA